MALMEIITFIVLRLNQKGRNRLANREVIDKLSSTITV